MKSFIKRILITICAVSASAVICTASVCASETARPMPGNGSTTATTRTDLTTSAGSQADTAADTEPESSPAAAVSSDTVTNNVTQTAATTNTTNSNVSNKKYLSKLGGFLWFLLSVIVNFIISCWVGNRFYQLARRNAQGSSEIRALRKDIEEKFASTLTDISEPATEVINSNENYARSEEGLAMPERRNHVEMNDEEREIVRRWDSKRTASRPDDDEDEYYDEEEEYYDDDDDTERRTSQRSYQPTRRRSGIEFEDEEDYDDEDEEYDRSYQTKRPARVSGKASASKPKKSSAGKKAKDFLSSVFPFDD